LRDRLSGPEYASWFSTAIGIDGENDGELVLAVPNSFCATRIRSHHASLLHQWSEGAGYRVEVVVREDATSGLAQLAAVNQVQAEDHRARELALDRQRQQPPGVITRLLAERGFWSLDPASQLALFQVDDLHGALQVIPSALGTPGTYEAAVFTGLLTLWAGGDRSEPRVHTSLRSLAELLDLSWGGRTAAELRHAIEVLKFTGYRAIGQNQSGGWERLFNLLNDVETQWTGPSTTPHRQVMAVFSDPIWQLISQPRVLRPVELSLLRALGHNRELAKRLFLFLEGTSMHPLESGRETVERIVDQRLAGTLGARGELRDLRRNLIRAGEAITSVAPRYERIEVVPRQKRGLRPGEPRYLLRIVRSRLAATPS